jgi:uncharacterized protein
MSVDPLTTELDLDQLVDAIRRHSGVTGKQPIAAVRHFVDASDPIHGPGDDGAIVPVGSHHVVACGEAISPPFVRLDPYGAGVAAVLANVNDVAAMGGVPLGIVNTIVATAEVAAEVLRGIRDAAAMYRVPVIGGHTTEHDGPPALSAFAVGEAPAVLSMANIAPGQQLLLACCLDGHMRPDFPFFTSIDQQRHRLGDDIRLFAQVAERNLAVACKDVSMAGPIGSLAMLLEFAKLGADVDLARLPMPADTDVEKWLISFPTYAFWLACADQTVDACVEVFTSVGLTCAAVGTVRHDTRLMLQLGDSEREVLDFSHEHITGLWQ